MREGLLADDLGLVGHLEGCQVELGCIHCVEGLFLWLRLLASEELGGYGLLLKQQRVDLFHQSTLYLHLLCLPLQ